MGAEVLDLLRVCGYIFCPHDDDDDGDDADGDDAKITYAYAYLTGVKLGIANILIMCYHDCSGASKQINRKVKRC